MMLKVYTTDMTTDSAYWVTYSNYRWWHTVKPDGRSDEDWVFKPVGVKLTQKNADILRAVIQPLFEGTVMLLTRFVVSTEKRDIKLVY